MTLDDIKALIQAMGSSDLAEMEVSRGGWTLRLSRESGPARRTDTADDRPPAPAAVRPREMADPAPELLRRDAAASPAVRAPLSGIVYLSASPGAAPFVTVGDTVAPGDILCTIEAMKTFNEVRSERAGTVEAILAEPGAEVEAGQPLVRIG